MIVTQSSDESLFASTGTANMTTGICLRLPGCHSGSRSSRAPEEEARRRVRELAIYFARLTDTRGHCQHERRGTYSKPRVHDVERHADDKQRANHAREEFRVKAHGELAEFSATVPHPHGNDSYYFVNYILLQGHPGSAEFSATVPHRPICRVPTTETHRADQNTHIGRQAPQRKGRQEVQTGDTYEES